MKEFLVHIWNVVDELTIFHTALLDDFSFKDICLSFFIFSFCGWCIESFYCSVGERKLINRGFLYGPMCPIYGAGCIVMHLTLTRFFDYPWAVVLLGMVICDVVEYITSFVMEKLFNARWWDYTGYFMNLNGRICLKHTIYWGIGAYCYIYIVQPFHLIWYSAIPEKYINIALVLIFAVFAVDLVMTVIAASDIHKLFASINRLKKSVALIADTVKLTAEEKSENISEIVKKESGEVIVKIAETSREIDELVTRLENTFKKYGLARVQLEKKYSSYSLLAMRGRLLLSEIKEKLGEISDIISGEDDEKY